MHLAHHITVISIIYFTSVSSAGCDNPGCDRAKQCIGRKLNDSDGCTGIIGYMSAFGPTTTYTGSHYLMCQGSYSCSSMEFIKLESMSMNQEIYCRGTNACSNTTLLYIGHNESNTFCQGTNACLGSNIYYNTSDRATIECGGYRSCANATIYGVNLVSAAASLSLHRAVIDTIGLKASNGAITINLRAHFAGYGAHLMCRANHNCTIYCNSLFACYNFYIDCMAPEGDNCEVISSNIPNRYLPLTNLTDFNTMSYDFNIFTDFPGAIVQIDTNIFCPRNGTHDSSPVGLTNITLSVDDEGPVCCRGANSCRSWSSITIEYETQKKTDLICSGEKACRLAYMKNINDTVFCEGYQSCQQSTIHYIDYIYCIGSFSCQSSQIIGSRYIKCDATRGCWKASIRSSGVDLVLYFNGHASGMDTIIYCDKTDVCTINCVGQLSCYRTQVICDTDGVNCIINCDLNIVEECPIVSVWNTTLITTTSIDTTPISYNTTDTMFVSTIQDDEEVDYNLIVIAIVIFVCFFMAVTAAKLFHSRKNEKKQLEIRMMMTAKDEEAKDEDVATKDDACNTDHVQVAECKDTDNIVDNSVSMSTLSVQVANNDTDTDNIDKDDVIIENEGDVIDTYRLDVKMHDNNDDKPIDEHEEGDLGNDYQTLEAGRKMNDSEMVVTCEGPNNSDNTTAMNDNDDVYTKNQHEPGQESGRNSESGFSGNSDDIYAEESGSSNDLYVVKETTQGGENQKASFHGGSKGT
eukprot:128799_1